jgi:ABC-type spermidine/putrescine transport system permease subunit II
MPVCRSRQSDGRAAGGGGAHVGIASAQSAIGNLCRCLPQHPLHRAAFFLLFRAARNRHLHRCLHDRRHRHVHWGGAFASDVIRSGILAIDPGIIEAAEVSGLRKGTIFRKIVMPIALLASVRPLGSVFINLILTSSILSTITLNELTGSAKIVASQTFRPFEVYFVLLVAYAALTWFVSILIGALHRYLNRNQAEGAV